MEESGGHSSVGRATASQAVGRGFEPLCPLFLFPAESAARVLRALAVLIPLFLLCGCLTPVGGKETPSGSAPPSPEPVAVSPEKVVSPVQAQEKGVYHVVGEGETLWRIAKAYGVGQEEIIRANNLGGAEIKVGQKLLIPGAIEQVEVSRYRPPRKGRKFVSGETFGYPCVGRVARGFGKGRGDQKTEGVDFAAAPGTKVVASRTGEVVFVAREFPGFGTVVVLKHGPSYRTFYGYLSDTSVRLGDAVAKGEIIAVSGSEPGTGKGRLHFRIYEKATAVNPLTFLR